MTHITTFKNKFSLCKFFDKLIEKRGYKKVADTISTSRYERYCKEYGCTQVIDILYRRRKAITLRTYVLYGKKYGTFGFVSKKDLILFTFVMMFKKGEN